MSCSRIVAAVIALALVAGAGAAGAVVAGAFPHQSAACQDCDVCSTGSVGSTKAKKGKVRVEALRLEYTGYNCPLGDGCNSQGSKASVRGDPSGTQTVQLDVHKSVNGKTTPLAISDAIELTELATDSYITVYSLGGSLLSTVHLHTSCSVPLLVGEAFGSFRVVGFTNTAGVVQHACSGCLHPDTMPPDQVCDVCGTPSNLPSGSSSANAATNFFTTRRKSPKHGKASTTHVYLHETCVHCVSNCSPPPYTASSPRHHLNTVLFWLTCPTCMRACMWLQRSCEAKTHMSTH